MRRETACGRDIAFGYTQVLFLLRISDLGLRSLGKGYTVDIANDFIVEVLDHPVAVNSKSWLPADCKLMLILLVNGKHGVVFVESEVKTEVKTEGWHASVAGIDGYLTTPFIRQTKGITDPGKVPPNAHGAFECLFRILDVLEEAVLGLCWF